VATCSSCEEAGIAAYLDEAGQSIGLFDAMSMGCTLAPERERMRHSEEASPQTWPDWAASCWSEGYRCPQRLALRCLKRWPTSGRGGPCMPAAFETRSVAIFEDSVLKGIQMRSWTAWDATCCRIRAWEHTARRPLPRSLLPPTDEATASNALAFRLDSYVSKADQETRAFGPALLRGVGERIVRRRSSPRRGRLNSGRRQHFESASARVTSGAMSMLAERSAAFRIESQR